MERFSKGRLKLSEESLQGQIDFNLVIKTLVLQLGREGGCHKEINDKKNNYTS